MILKEQIIISERRIPAPDLNFLFHPHSIAVVGASKDTNKAGGRFVRILLDWGYEGKIFPINHNEREILGLKAYPSLHEVEDHIDLAIIVIPAAAVLPVIKECGEKGVKFAVIHTAGFAELGMEGKELQNLIAKTALDYGVRLIGPNCMGVLCAESKVSSMFSFKPELLEKGNAALLAQSGTIFNAMTRLSFDRGLKLDKAVSIGNQADLRDIDYLHYFGKDPDTRVIMAYLEGITNGKQFVRVAREVSAEKPIIVWIVGQTKAGIRAAISHTAALVTSEHLCDAAFKQAGVLKARHMEELCDMAVAFSSPHIPAGKRIGLLVDSGGQGVILCDACEKEGLELPIFSSEMQQQLRALLTGYIPPFSGTANPVDLVWPNYNEILKLYTGCLEIMAKAVDAIIMYTFVPYNENITDRLRDLRDHLKIPIFIVPAFYLSTKEWLQKYIRKGFPAYPTAERAAKAMSALVHYAEYRREIIKERLEQF